MSFPRALPGPLVDDCSNGADLTPPRGLFIQVQADRSRTRRVERGPRRGGRTVERTSTWSTRRGQRRGELGDTLPSPSLSAGGRLEEDRQGQRGASRQLRMCLCPLSTSSTGSMTMSLTWPFLGSKLLASRTKCGLQRRMTSWSSFSFHLVGRMPGILSFDDVVVWVFLSSRVTIIAQRRIFEEGA